MSQSTTFFSVFTSHTQGKIFFILLCEALFFFFPQRYEVPLKHFLLCSFHRASLWVSVVILSLLWWFCPFSDHPVPSVLFLLLFWVCHYLLVEGYKQNCLVPALGLRFKGLKFPDSLYSQVFRFKIIDIWKRSMPSTNSPFQELLSFPHSSSFFHRITLHTAISQEILIQFAALSAELMLLIKY